MHYRRLLPTFLVLTVLSPSFAIAADNASAQQPKAKAVPVAKAQAQPEWAGLFGGAPLPVVWQSAAAANEKITSALAERKFEGVADWAETIHFASHALVDQVKTGALTRGRELKAALRQAIKFSDEVTKGAQRGELAQAIAGHGQVDSALALAKSLLPREILDAPPQELRFAKIPEAPPGEKGAHEPKKNPP